MTHKIVVAYDGSDAAKKALEFAVPIAKSHSGEVVVAHVLEWSQYSFLTPTEIEERHQRRKDELDRAQKAVIDPVVASLNDSGVKVSTELRYGHIADMLSKIAEEHGADQIVVGRVGQSEFKTRVFGSVAGSLAQSAPVPVTIVP